MSVFRPWGPGGPRNIREFLALVAIAGIITGLILWVSPHW